MNLKIPDITTLYLDGEVHDFKTQCTFDDGAITYEQSDGGLKVFLTAGEKGVRFLRLRWNQPMRKDVKVLGDAWERGYGDLCWNTVDQNRCMPWYIAVSNGSDRNRVFTGRLTECFGVGVQPNALAFWQYDNAGVTLWLDVRCGGSATFLGGRTLLCATVFFREYRDISAFEAVQAFCSVMSPTPALTDHVVYGSNNWYYAYGKSSEKEILADTLILKELCRDCENPPYMVIDDGWQPKWKNPPFDRGNEQFPDMQNLASKMREIGVRPGIWVRYLGNGAHFGQKQQEWKLERCESILDPSHPEVLELVKEMTQRLVNWGYTLIKHDYSTVDVFGKWGFESPNVLTENGWSFYDKTKTSAEIIRNFYKTIQDAAGKAVVIGCNTIGHLSAGIHQLSRTGDDTSGIEWSTTLKMGVNALAFRMPQHNRFFGADADCVGITGAIDWEYNKQWLDIVARSGTTLFVSCKPDVPSPAEKEDLKKAFQTASLQKDELIPLDWMETTTPEEYLINGETVTFRWFPEKGGQTFEPSVR